MSCAGQSPLEEGKPNACCETARPPRRRMSSRWWLAGLLVSCLLPAGLVQGDAIRLANRVVQICWLAPSAIRAESRRLARRCCWRPAVRHVVMVCCKPRLRSLTQRLRHVAGADVLSRRGPPGAYFHFA